ncbi:Uncharacterised protein [Vibrio cholerae]|nr:Uncharacterised protein [Vibrio cholerae]
MIVKFYRHWRELLLNWMQSVTSSSSLLKEPKRN